jgi:hypothetical protein
MPQRLLPQQRWSAKMQPPVQLRQLLVTLAVRQQMPWQPQQTVFKLG